MNDLEIQNVPQNVQQEPSEPFDLNKLKIELNNITIMYGPPDVTIRRAERAMVAYINALCDDEEGNQNAQITDLEAKLKETLTAVSYTHLTLPTKRIV